MLKSLYQIHRRKPIVVELNQAEVKRVTGGNPVIVMAAYVAARYFATRVGAGLATGALGGATTGYLESDS
jgi:hypothetical protein